MREYGVSSNDTFLDRCCRVIGKPRPARHQECNWSANVIGGLRLELQGQTLLWSCALDVYLVDDTYELFRHYYALPSARDSGREVAAVSGAYSRRSWA